MSVESDIQELIPQVSRLPRSVATTILNIDNQFPITIEALERTAQSLEATAQSLREKADYLRDQIKLSHQLKTVVELERSFWDEVMSLGLVQPRQRESQE